MSACLLDFVSYASLPHPLHLSNSVVFCCSNTPTKRLLRLPYILAGCLLPKFCIFDPSCYSNLNSNVTSLKRPPLHCLKESSRSIFNFLLCTYYCLTLPHSVQLLHCLTLPEFKFHDSRNPICLTHNKVPVPGI